MMNMQTAAMMTGMSSLVGWLAIAFTFRHYFPHELRRPLRRYFHKLINFFNPYITISFSEYQPDGFQRNIAYDAIKRYLNAHSAIQAKRLRATVVRDTDAFVITMADNEEVTDQFKATKLWWVAGQISPPTQTIAVGNREVEKNFFALTFHRKFRDVIRNEYLKHVLEEGKAIAVRERRRKLFTNIKANDDRRLKLWSEVEFDHPATFRTLAMDPHKKQQIVDDLINFSKSKDYYKSVGKAWKRGYLLYGPPGTGKSTMVAAMANLLEYDVYDLELTAVRDNTELRKLLIDTSSKSIILIEDIDCSLQLTGQREKKEQENGGEEKDEERNELKKKLKKEEKKPSEVTLSGLLNFIDGLWSSCGGERIIVFTTNYKDKLDPALIRRGRMDMHVELSYCGFEAFKVLAKNYLNIEYDDWFDTIRRLLEETNMSPADVAENLMPKLHGEAEERCLKRLVEALEEAKEDARRKAEEEEKLKAEKIAKEEEEEEKKKKAAKEEKKSVEKESGEADKVTSNGVAALVA